MPTGSSDELGRGVASPEPAATESRDDPLHDPVLSIFAYSGWAVTTWLFGGRAGLIALVAAAVAVVITGLRHSRDRPPGVRFGQDLGLITLCCAATIGAVGLGLLSW